MAKSNSTIAAIPTYQGAGRRYRRIIFIAFGVIFGTVIVILVFILMYKSSLSNSPSEADQATTDKVVSETTSISSTELDQVGLGSSQSNVVKITNGETLKDSAGKPKILYVGAEYCPYCALERWAMVVALSRFGTFSGLSLTKSSSSDIFANTPTLTFRGASFSSTYLAFETVEEYGNIRQSNGSYNVVQTLTADQQAIINLYDAPPYTSSSEAIPFVDFANQYVFSGASASPSIIQGMDWSQVVTGLKNPSSDVAKGILGSANLVASILCQITNDQPSQVCHSQAVKSAAAAISK